MARSTSATLCLLLWLAGCAPAGTPRHDGDRVQGVPLRIAVFPMENLSGKRLPVDEARRRLLEHLGSLGLDVVGDDVLEAVLTKHRVRYTAGVDADVARALKADAAVDGVLLTSLELFDEAPASRVALFARLVSTSQPPTILWADSRGAAGGDSAGLLDLGAISDPAVLLDRALESLGRSLARHVSGAPGPGVAPSVEARFRPRITYRAAALEPGSSTSIAVVPFVNRSARAHGGEVVALHLIESLTRLPGVRVVEPGMVRQGLLQFRIIMADGVSLADTDTILNAVNADFVLNGEVLQYEDPHVSLMPPRVDFSVLIIAKRTRKVVFSAYSQSAGDQGVFFFDWGRISTAHAMASQMARAVGESFQTGPPTTAGPQRAGRQEGKQ